MDGSHIIGWFKLKDGHRNLHGFGRSVASRNAETKEGLFEEGVLKSR